MNRLKRIGFLSLAVLFVHVFCFAAIVDKILVVVNDEVITQREVDRYLAPVYEQLSAAYGANVFSENSEKIEEMRQQIINQLIKDKLVLSEARRRGIEVTEAEVKEQLNNVKKRFKSDEEFYKALDRQGITLKELEDNYRSSIMARKLIEGDISSRVSLTPAEVVDYYQQYKDEFRVPPSAHVMSILIKAEPGANDEEALAIAEAILERLHRGDAFSALAREYSNGPNASSGGDMGYVKKGEMIKRIDETIFNLSPGETSGILRTDIGFHIFKVEDVQDSRIQSFDEVSKLIERKIFNAKSKEKLDKFIAQLEESAYIEYK